jgi:hypothetical protein
VAIAWGEWVGSFIFDVSIKNSQFWWDEKWLDGGGGKGIS